MSVNVANYTHQDILNNHPEILAKQYALEEEASGLAKSAIASAIEANGISEASPTVRRRIHSLTVKASAGIQQFIDEQASVRRKSPALKYITLVEPEVLALITLRTVINGLAGTKNEVKFTRTALRTSNIIKEIVEYEVFAEANPGLAVKLERQLARSTSGQHRRAVIRAGMRSADFEGIDWNEKDLAVLGGILVSSVGETTGLYQREVVKRGKQQVALLSGTQALADILAEADAMDAVFEPFRYPMIMPPQPWTDCYDGGYLNKRLNSLKLARVRRASIQSMLDASDIDDVLDAVNAIQATPWRINENVFTVFKYFHEFYGGHAPDLPEKPWAEEEEPEEDVLKAWKKEASAVHRERSRWTSKRIVATQQVALAERFLGETIYFPHTLDFRGRIYPEAGLGAINPQGNDAGKALLEFARGKLVTEDGYDWLLIHAANSYGVDKVSLDDRKLWAEMHIDLMTRIAEDPINNRDWQLADKPWAFLAASFEVAGYLADPENFLSHLPISVDGSCSGLQHFGAMLRCPQTASAVNVVQSGTTPADVYGVVLRRVQELVSDLVSEDEYAREWSTRLSRNIVKQPTMTTPYGVTGRGMVEQIADNARKLIGKGQMAPFESVEVHDAARWLAPLVEQGIASEVAAATKAMDWLGQVAAKTASANMPVRWETPVGFLAVQEYRKTTGRVAKFTWNGAPVEMRLSVDTNNIWAIKQKSGLAPNFVHSMDAAHLMVTVNNAVEYGIHDFAMVHDSFGCHASDVPMLSAVLRECFVAIYSEDVLGDFHAQLRQQLPADVFDEIPPPPALGTLDIEAVRESAYFFA